MKKLIACSLLFMSLNSFADVWLSVVPEVIHVVPEGLVVRGQVDVSTVTCATTSGFFIPKSDANYNAKLTTAMAAKATKRKIEVLIPSPYESACMSISAVGNVPAASHYHWAFN